MFSDCVNQQPLRRELVFVSALPFPFDCKQRRILASILVSILVFPLPESISYGYIGYWVRTPTAPVPLYYLISNIIGECSEMAATR
jgi:hypothetical protein